MVSLYIRASLIALLLFGFPSSSLAARMGASIVPIGTWVEEISGEEVDVVVAPGQNPVLFEPTSRQLAELSRCERLFVIGVPAERAVVPRLRRMSPGMEIVDLSEGLVEVDATSRAHGKASHTHSELDPHFWMNPVKALRIIEKIEAVLAFESENPTVVHQRAAALKQRWIQLHADLGERLTGLKGRPILAYHPALGHFAEAYGLVQYAVETGGAEPGAKHVKNLIELVAAEHIGMLIVEPQFSPNRAKALAAALGIEVQVIDPLAADLPTELRRLATLIVADAARAEEMTP